MDEYLLRIEELFGQEEPATDETGSLAGLAEALGEFRPRLLAAVGPGGEILAVWQPAEGEPLSAERVRSAVAAGAERAEAPGPEVQPDPRLGSHRMTIPVEGEAGKPHLLLGWFERDPGGPRGDPIRAILRHAAAVAVRAIRISRRAVELETRVQHLRNEQEVLSVSHNRIVAEMLEAKDEQARQQREYVTKLETEVERRSAALREALREAEFANEAKSSFLANVSHEIRTPMTAILGYTDLILDPEATREEIQEYVGVIKGNGEHLLQILNDILDHAKIEARQLSVEIVDFDVRQLVEEVVSLLNVRAREKGIRLAAEFDDGIPDHVRSDPTRVRQILVNLVGNAVKFTEKGCVRVITKHRQDREAEYLDFRVTDTGIGMTRDQVDELFRPFAQADSSTTRKFGGTGLGLYISRNLARMLGGDIAVKSECGFGSEFRATIRLTPGLRSVPEDSPPASEAPPSPEPDVAGRPIVSDCAQDEDLAAIVKDFLAELPERIAGLRASLEENDLPRLAVLAGQLKSEGAAAGFAVLLRKGEALEASCREVDVDAARAAIRELESLLPRLTVER